MSFFMSVFLGLLRFFAAKVLPAALDLSRDPTTDYSPYFSNLR